MTKSNITSESDTHNRKQVVYTFTIEEKFLSYIHNKKKQTL